MFNTYIDPTTNLPKHLGEVYTDRHIKITGQARLYSGFVDTLGVKVVTTPVGGGAAAITAVTDAHISMPNIGDSLWLQLNRNSGTSTVSLQYYASGSQPKPTENLFQLFYKLSATEILSPTVIISDVAFYTSIGYGRQYYDAIVGEVGDINATHTDFQVAINDVNVNSRILIKKAITVDTTININKTLELEFTPSSSLIAGTATTGLFIGANNCNIHGYGRIQGFTVAGINLNGYTGTRIEMLFSSNTVNILSTGLTGIQYNLEGSSGLTENSHIEIGTVDGQGGRWNNTTKRWEKVTGLIITSTGKITVADTTASTNKDTGSIVTEGGLGVEGNINAGGSVSGTLVYNAVYNS
jgi:hypothetical protein